MVTSLHRIGCVPHVGKEGRLPASHAAENGRLLHVNYPGMASTCPGAGVGRFWRPGKPLAGSGEAPDGPRRRPSSWRTRSLLARRRPNNHGHRIRTSAEALEGCSSTSKSCRQGRGPNKPRPSPNRPSQGPSVQRPSIPTCAWMTRQPKRWRRRAEGKSERPSSRWTPHPSLEL